jgi:uncharacterized membrane protein
MTTIIGTTGALIILVSFLLNQRNILKKESLCYDFMNFFGSLLLVIYAYLLESYPFIVLNAVWGLFSLFDCYIDLKKKNGK